MKLDLVRVLRQDYLRNKGNHKSLFILCLFRIANVIYSYKKHNKFIWLLGVPYLIFYRILVEWLLCVELPYGCKIGAGLIIDHGYALVVNRHAVIGENCLLRNSTTIGCKLDSEGKQLPSPRIGDNVDVGANAVIIGDIKIGNNVRIGAGSVVVKDIPDDCVVAGNPARVIRSAPQLS